MEEKRLSAHGLQARARTVNNCVGIRIVSKATRGERKADHSPANLPNYPVCIRRAGQSVPEQVIYATIESVRCPTGTQQESLKTHTSTRIRDDC